METVLSSINTLVGEGECFQSLQLTACVDLESSHRQRSDAPVLQMVLEAEIYSIMQLIIKTKAFWHQSLKMLFYRFLSFKNTKYIESFRFLSDIKRQTKSIKFNVE